MKGLEANFNGKTIEEQMGWSIAFFLHTALTHCGPKDSYNILCKIYIIQSEINIGLTNRRCTGEIINLQ